MKNKITLLLTKNISIILGIFFVTNYGFIDFPSIWYLFKQKVDEWTSLKSIIIDYIGHIIILIIIILIIIRTIIQCKEIKNSTKQ